MTPQEILYSIKKECIDIHKEFGPGLLEKAYQRILKLKLEKRGFVVNEEVACSINVDGEIIENAYYIDLLVNDCVIVELKAVQKLKPEHHKQLFTYMRLANKDAGLLVNFCCDNLFRDGLRSWNKAQLNLFSIQ